MDEQPISPEAEALQAVADAAGDLTDAVLRVLGQVEVQSEALARIAASVAGIRSEIRDLAWPMQPVTSPPPGELLLPEDLIV